MRGLVLISGLVAVVGAIAITMNSKNEDTPKIVEVQSPQAKQVDVDIDNSLNSEISKLESDIKKVEVKKDNNQNTIEEKAFEKVVSATTKTLPVVKSKVINKKKPVTKKIISKVKKTKTEPLTEDEVKTSQSSTQPAADGQSQLNLADNAAFASKSPFSAMLDSSFSTDSKTFEDDKAYGNQTSLFINYRLNNQYTARLFMAVSKELSDGYETVVGDTRIRIAKRGFKAGEVTLLPSASIVLPTSERSKRNEEKIGGVELNLGGLYQISNAFSLFYLPRFTKNFHEFETSRTDVINVDYSIMQILSLGYQYNDKWSLTPTLLYSNSWAYGGTERDPSFMSILELGYFYSRSLQLAAGTSTGGTIVNLENAPDKNLQLYDSNTASFYGRFTLMF